MQLNAEIAEFDEASERDLPFVQELEANIEELSQKISGLNNQQASLLVTYKKMREKSTQMATEVRNRRISSRATSELNRVYVIWLILK